MGAWKGAWVSTTAYAVGDRVLVGSVVYLAVAGNTNSQPGSPSANWTVWPPSQADLQAAILANPCGQYVYLHGVKLSMAYAVKLNDTAAAASLVFKLQAIYDQNPGAMNVAIDGTPVSFAELDKRLKQAKATLARLQGRRRRITHMGLRAGPL